ncbi:MAG: outer membrane beta-barrel family protein, partial [Flavobacteriales bacterium]|nr:outer membrane beta-barrel family protein [Flavobacteriales bacterium]
RAFGLWSFQTGLRSEQANTESYLDNNDSTYKADYLELYPSLHLNYKLDESSSIQASYSRRVNRPGFHALNPFPKYSDPYNLRMGNPFLKPEFVNAVELGYQKFDEGTTLSASIYVKDINDKQRRYISVDSSNVSTVTYQNLNGSLDIGFEFMWSKQVSKTFNFMLSSNIYHSKMDASNLTRAYDESTIGMRSGFNAGWKKNGHKIQLSGWVRPGGEVGQGKMKTMFNTDLVYAKTIFSNKGKLTLKLSDVFNTSGFGIDTFGERFDQSFTYKRRSQILSLSLSCNFGNNNENRSSSKRRGSYSSPRDTDGGFF